MVTVVEVPTGALFGPACRVKVLGTGSESTPSLAVPPSSCTWKGKTFTEFVPLPIAGGANVSRPDATSDTGITCPAVTAVPLSASSPTGGSD